MEPIEEKLKRAMNRVDAPDGFVARVMARVQAQPLAAQTSFGKRCARWFECLWHSIAHPVPAGAMVIVILVALGVCFGHWGRQGAFPLSEQERIAGRKASAQLVLALKIAGGQLSRMHALLSQPSPGNLAPAGNDAQPGVSH